MQGSRKTRPILTIAIPTRNRADFLDRQLQRCGQIDPGPWQILVADNSSSDNTAGVAQKHKNMGLAMEFHSHSHDLGLAGNVEFLYRASDSDFIWFLSDDDSFDPSFLNDSLWQLLRNETLGLVVLNQTEHGLPAIHRIRDVDLVPWFPIGISRRWDTGVLGTAKSEFDRCSLVLLSSQISCGIVRVVDDVQGLPEYGGLPHSYFAMKALEAHSGYFITKDLVIDVGPKPSLSGEFIRSCLTGLHDLYVAQKLIHDATLATIISLNTTRFGLRCLRRGVLGLETVDYFPSSRSLRNDVRLRYNNLLNYDLAITQALLVLNRYEGLARRVRRFVPIIHSAGKRLQKLLRR